MDPCGDYRELLLHAVRIRRDGLREVSSQPEHIGIFMYALAAVVSADAENIRDEVQIFYSRHVFIEVGIVGDIGYDFFSGERVIFYRDAVYCYLTLVEQQNADNGFERCGLARAVVADEAVYLAGRDMQRQVVNSLFLAVGFGQVFDVKHNVSFSSAGADRYLFPFLY